MRLKLMQIKLLCRILKAKCYFFAARLRSMVHEMRTRSKVKSDKAEKKKRDEDDFFVLCGAVSLTDSRKKSSVYRVHIPRKAAYDDVVGILSQEFDDADSTTLRFDQLK